MKSPTSSAMSSLFNTPKTTLLKKKLRDSHRKLQFKTKLVKNLKRQNNRLKEKYATLKEVIQELKKRRFVDEALDDELSKGVENDEDIMKILFSRRKTPFSKFPPALRKFALTLHFYSPSAYKYLRDKFKKTLPHPHTLYRWYKSIDAEPGFTSEAFTILADKVSTSPSSPLLCSLTVDEMAIRQQKIWTGTKYEGLVDMGIGFKESDAKATQAYVFLLVSLDQSWTLPIAYFFVQSLTGEMKANLIEIALKKCHDVGVKVASLTFDGCKTNINCMKVLGCKLDNHADMKTTFKHPCADYEVAVLLDACHMVKLVRNTLESKKEIYDDTNNIIKWNHIVSLHNLQEENNLHLANKLTPRHINFRNEIMKVKLASQLLSNSVANAIEFCSKELKIDTFSKSDATVRFIKLINYLFDILNSRNFNSFGFKKPMSPENNQEIISFCKSATSYLLSLTTKEMLKTKKDSRVEYRGEQVPLHKGRLNTGIIGLIICMNSLQHLYTTLIETNIMSYLTMYKFSQDHIEIFFGKIRSQGGHNNNPNARQFKSAYKKLLSHMELSSKFSGNCLPLEDIPILNSTTKTMQRINTSSISYRYEDEEENEENIAMIFIEKRVLQEEMEEKYINNCDHLSKSLEGVNEVTKQIIGYISGFVVYHLLKKLHCDDCKNHLLATEKKWFHKLVDIKDMGGLCFASDDVFLICCETEKCVRGLMNVSGGKTILRQYNKVFITNKVLRSLVNINLFTRTDAHDKDQFNHMYDLTKAIIEKYVDVRLHYICKKENQEKKDNSKRQKYNKLNLFHGT